MGNIVVHGRYRSETGSVERRPFEEFFVARDSKFYCGSYQAVIGNFNLCFYLFTILSFHINVPRYKLELSERHLRAANPEALRLDSGAQKYGRSAFLELLKARRGSGCIDPRGLIYSLLGLYL